MIQSYRLALPAALLANSMMRTPKNAIRALYLALSVKPLVLNAHPARSLSSFSRILVLMAASQDSMELRDSAVTALPNATLALRAPPTACHALVHSTSMASRALAPALLESSLKITYAHPVMPAAANAQLLRHLAPSALPERTLKRQAASQTVVQGSIVTQLLASLVIRRARPARVQTRTNALVAVPDSNSIRLPTIALLHAPLTNTSIALQATVNVSLYSCSPS